MLTHRKSELISGMLLAVVAIVGIAMVAIVYTFSEGISGNDFWWHIKVGEWIVEHNKVPTTDIFSWYGVAHQIPWTAHEWLADVILYLIYKVTGQIGIFVLSIGAAFTMFFLLWHEAKKHVQNNILIGGLFFALFAVTTSVFFYGRPHLFSFFLLYWELKVLFAFTYNPKSKGIYSIPLLTCIWSNIHGGSAAISYVICGVFLVAGLLNVQIGKIAPSKMDRTSIIKLLVITLGSVVAILINPVGLDVLVYPFKSFGDQLQMTLISEWRSPDAKEIGDLVLFIIPIALMLIGFFQEEKKIRLIDLAIMGLFVFLFLRSVRFIMLWYISAVFCAFPYVPKCKIKPMSRKSEVTFVVACIAVFLAVIGMSISPLISTINNNKLISRTMSDEAVAVVKEDNPERLFNDYNLGEALIFNEIPVFFDARADLFAYDNIMADGVSLSFLEQANSTAETAYVDVATIVERYQFDAILILKSRPLYAYLVSQPSSFECLYEDDGLGYFKVIQ